MKIKTAELKGAALDWAVASCNGKTLHYFADDPLKREPWLMVSGDVDQPLHSYTPSTDWSQGGLIIEREFISVECDPANDNWAATIRDNVPSGFVCGSGRTPLIAAMRCYVASKLGEAVDIPEEVA